MSVEERFGIYHVLATLIKDSKRPLTSVEVFDSPDVRTFAKDVNKVSDYLGHMYRRGLLARVPSRGIGMAKFAYTWKDGAKVPEIPEQRHAQPRLMVRSPPPPQFAEPRTAIKVVDNHDGSVTLKTPSLSITISSR